MPDEKCSKCGAGFDCDDSMAIHFKCGSFRCGNGEMYESPDCLKVQLAAMTEREKRLRARLCAYTDEAHRLSDCLRAHDGGGIPSSDADDAFSLLRAMEHDAGLKPMDGRKAADTLKESGP